MKVVIIALVICSSLAQAKLLRLTPLSEQSKYVGCIHYSGRQSPSCGGCYRRRRNSDVCGSLQPESDPCDIYTKDGLGRDICSHCKPGYTLDRTAKIGQRCTKKPLSNHASPLNSLEATNPPALPAQETPTSESTIPRPSCTNAPHLPESPLSSASGEESR